MAGAFTAYFAADGAGRRGLPRRATRSLALPSSSLVAMLTSMIIARAARAHRLPPAAQRAAPGAAHHRHRRLAVPAVRLPRAVRQRRALVSRTSRSWTARFDIAGIPFRATQLMVIVSAIVLMIGLWYLVNRTRTGRAMRAVSRGQGHRRADGHQRGSHDRHAPSPSAGCWPARPACCTRSIFSQVFFAMGFIPGIKAFTAAVLGGIGNIVGAMLGGLILGMLEQVGPNLFLTGYGIPAPTSCATASPSPCWSSCSSSGPAASSGGSER